MWYRCCLAVLEAAFVGGGGGGVVEIEQGQWGFFQAPGGLAEAEAMSHSPYLALAEVEGALGGILGSSTAAVAFPSARGATYMHRGWGKKRGAVPLASKSP